MNKIRVLVVEDQSIVREGMVAILSLQPDIEVVGEAEDGIEAVQMARKAKPDVILLDMVMPRQDGLTTIPRLKEIVPTAKILVLSGFAESNRVYQAVKIGALGYMLKDTPRVQLLQAIRDVARGQARQLAFAGGPRGLRSSPTEPLRGSYHDRQDELQGLVYRARHSVQQWRA